MTTTNKCLKCGKTFVSSPGAALSVWLFRLPECNCEAALARIDLPPSQPIHVNGGKETDDIQVTDELCQDPKFYAQFHKSLSVAPVIVAESYSKANDLVKNKKYKNAAAILESLGDDRSMRKYSAWIKTQAGKCFQKSANHQAAIECFTDSLSLSKNPLTNSFLPPFVALYLRSQSYFASGDLEKALADANKALREKPDYKMASNLRTRILRRAPQ